MVISLIEMKECEREDKRLAYKNGGAKFDLISKKKKGSNSKEQGLTNTFKVS